MQDTIAKIKSKTWFEGVRREDNLLIYSIKMAGENEYIKKEFGEKYLQDRMLLPKQTGNVRMIGLERAKIFHEHSKKQILKNPEILIDKINQDNQLLEDLANKSKEIKNNKDVIEIIDLFKQHGFLFFLCFSLGLQLFKNKDLIDSKELVNKALKIHDDWRNNVAEKEEQILNNLSSVLKNIAEELNLNKFEDIYYLDVSEVEAGLKKGFDKKLKQEIDKRKKEYIYICILGRCNIITNKNGIGSIMKDFEKDKKIFIREHSREYSLFRVFIWHHIVQKWMPHYLGIGVDEACLVYKGGDLVDVYYLPESLKGLFGKIAVLANDTEQSKKLLEEFYQLFRILKPYYDQQKKVQSIDELKQLYKIYSKFWALISFIFVVPTLEQADKELKDLTLKAREEMQEYNESFEVVLKDFLENRYPNLKNNYRFVLPEEVWSGEVEGPEIINKIKERKNGYVFYKGKLYPGKEIEKFLEDLNIILSDGKETGKEVKEIKGQVANKGQTKGIVKLVTSVKDLNKVNEGDVLVSPMTMPKYLPAMKKASAFITDEGGITCHAAIISREMNKPCIIGTKIATQVLKDGMEVEVNADKGIIKIIK